MLKKTLMITLLVALAAAPLLAHSGHEHKIMAVVNSLHGDNLAVTATDGDKVTVTLTKATKLFRGDKEMSRSDLVEGERVVIEMTRDGKSVAVIRLGPKPKSK